jgi:hypothetical protein
MSHTTNMTDKEWFSDWCLRLGQAYETLMELLAEGKAYSAADNAKKLAEAFEHIGNDQSGLGGKHQRRNHAESLVNSYFSFLEGH